MQTYDQCAIYVSAERNLMGMLYGQGKKSFSADKQ